MIRESGFTLIELLVVIAIIAILAAILFPVFAQAHERAAASTNTPVTAAQAGSSTTQLLVLLPLADRLSPEAKRFTRDVASSLFAHSCLYLRRHCKQTGFLAEAQIAQLLESGAWTWGADQLLRLRHIRYGGRMGPELGEQDTDHIVFTATFDELLGEDQIKFVGRFILERIDNAMIQAHANCVDEHGDIVTLQNAFDAVDKILADGDRRWRPKWLKAIGHAAAASVAFVLGIGAHAVVVAIAEGHTPNLTLKSPGSLGTAVAVVLIVEGIKAKQSRK